MENFFEFIAIILGFLSGSLLFFLQIRLYIKKKNLHLKEKDMFIHLDKNDKKIAICSFLSFLLCLVFLILREVI